MQGDKKAAASAIRMSGKVVAMYEVHKTHPEYGCSKHVCKYVDKQWLKSRHESGETLLSEDFKRTTMNKRKESDEIAMKDEIKMQINQERDIGVFPNAYSCQRMPPRILKRMKTRKMAHNDESWHTSSREEHKQK
jgi:hypothetical protein